MCIVDITISYMSARAAAGGHTGRCDSRCESAGTHEADHKAGGTGEESDERRGAATRSAPLPPSRPVPSSHSLHYCITPH